jgi:hypothetical protein
VKNKQTAHFDSFNHLMKKREFVIEVSNSVLFFMKKCVILLLCFDIKLLIIVE